MPRVNTPRRSVFGRIDAHLWSHDAYSVPQDEYLYSNNPINNEYRTTPCTTSPRDDSTGSRLSRMLLWPCLIPTSPRAATTTRPRSYASTRRLWATRPRCRTARFDYTSPFPIPIRMLKHNQRPKAISNNPIVFYIVVLQVITNYSVADIPSETMQTDIGEH